MIHRQLALAAAIASPLAAQVPVDAAVVLESTQLLDPYYKLVDTFGRGATTLRDQNAFMTVAAVAVDPSTDAWFYWIGAAFSLPGTWRSEVLPLAQFGTTLWGPWSQAPALRVAVGSTRIVTLESSGAVEAYLKPSAGGTPPISLTIPGATDVAITGQLLYTVANGAVQENDLASGASRTVGTYAGGISIAVTPNGQELTIGTQTGDLVRVDPTTGTVVGTQPTALGAITAVEYTRYNTRVWSNGTELWSELAPSAPIYVSPTAILDFSVGLATGPSITTYGAGCGIAQFATWDNVGVPSLGNSTFSLGLIGAPALAPCLLALGASRSVWSAANAPLPFDLQVYGAPGCSLLADPAVNLLLFSDSGGTVYQNIPIPNLPALAGREFAAQFFVPTGSFGTLGAASTEGVAFVID